MKKKIILTGATGLIGRSLLQALDKYNYSVIALTTGKNRNSSFQAFRCKVVNIGTNHDLWKNELNGAYGIINLAGAPISKPRWDNDYKNEIIESRVGMTSMLVKELKNLSSKPVLINASAIGIYGNRGNEQLNESSRTGNGFLADVCIKWESEALEASDFTRVVLARIGVVLAKNGGALEKMIPPFKMMIGGPIGSGKQWMSWIHIDDLVNLLIWSLEKADVSGPVNCTAPNPVIMNDFAETLGKVLNKPSFLRVPTTAIKLIMGETASIVLDSQRVNPGVALDMGYTFKFPKLALALKDLL